MIGKLAVALATLVSGAAASAQWTPGSEIIGQEVEVVTNGITNTVRFQEGGVATISTPTGNMVDATWTADAGKLCLKTASTADCYPYARPFAPNAPVSLLSDCGTMSRWTALLPAAMAGERG